MLERIVAWVLNNYLGKYVENLNTDQLSVALLQGEVELENLPLKKDALRHIGLPIQVCAGYIGKVKLQIPVPQIRSAPWVIIIEQLCLVTGPVKLSEWDDEAEEQAAQDYKLSLLDEMEATWRAETESAQASSYYATSYSSWLSLGTSLVANIIENLQLKIKDVHIRYEDNVTVPGQVFALGVTIESLTAQSCDDKWMPRFVGWDSGDTSFKLMELSTLAVYWDKLTEDQLLGGLSLGELAVAMSQYLTLKHQFVLSPVSAQAHIKRNRSEQPLRSRTQPRIVCDLHLEEVPLSLTDWQYGQMVGCVKGLQVIEKCRRYRKWRPDVTISENAQAWWHYAAKCLMNGWRHSTPASWEIALQRARENVTYVEMYSRILLCPTAAVPPDMKQLKDAMELERGMEELRSLREVAMRRVRPPERDVIPSSAPPATQGRGTLLYWFPQLWGWNYSTPEVAALDATDMSTGVESTPSMTELELEDQILDVLADTVENNTILRRDVVFGQFNFTLKQGTFNLCTTKKTENENETEKLPLMELQFENVKLGLESRPRSGSHKFHISLGAMFLRDHLTRDTAFPQLVGPHDRDGGSVLGRGGVSGRTFTPGLAKLLNQGSAANKTQPEEPLFKLVYEYRPFNSNMDYRLHIQSRSLDVVYNPAAVKWLADFFTRPHQTPDAQLRRAARQHYEVMKQRTKQEFIRNWEQILEGKLNDRKTWDVELDIWGPRIMFVEHFCDKNALMVVVDFGKFHFSNQPEAGTAAPVATQTRESDEEDFQTPCSTPHGSEASISESQTLTMSAPSKTDDFLNSSFTDLTLHQKLYDRYTMELGDLQILVGRVRDNFKYAHQRGTSTLHVLDRFNISLQVERRVVFTTDPQFPSLTVSGNLPRLVVHVNEQKVDALRTMAAIISGKGLPSPFRSQQSSADDNLSENMTGTDACSSAEPQEWTGKEVARLVMLQFSIDQMALEVQSRGRCVAELQVSGVRAAYTKRPYDTSISLSVHSLLLVDALQMFGPDFELLVASHKHVGMDSVSGSLRDSEPTSPTSPASPDPLGSKALKTTSPIALTQALSSLQSDTSPSLRAVSPTNVIPSSPPYPMSPPHIAAGRPPSINLDILDTEALITLEIFLVSANCPSNEGSGEALQIASIQFNNLDIIANQETIVELIGFTRRVFPQLKSGPKRPLHAVPVHIDTGTASSQDEAYATPQEDMGVGGGPGQGSSITRTELTFDFHRLNILLLRAVMKDCGLVGRKIGTATMTEAKVQATVGRDLVVQGSLGGLQVLDLTPEGQTHQRILSLGKDPLVERNVDLVSCLDAELYSMCHQPVTNAEENRAFSFNVRRPLGKMPPECAEIKLRMASVWYTHSPHFVTELQSCATEFKQYLTNVARSIKSAATEMAMGLVHARTEALAQTLYMNSRLSSSLYGGSGWEMSPRRRRRSSLSQSFEQLEGVSSTRGTTPHTPYSPSMDEDSLDLLLDVKLDIVLDTPVVVLPRSPDSRQVFVAHLGKITANNHYMSSPDFQDRDDLWGMSRRERYNVEIRDMNLYSLDTEKRSMKDTSNLHPIGEYPLMRAERLYSCVEDGKPILHDTVIQLIIDRDIGRSVMRQSDSLPTLLMGDDAGTEFQEIEKQDVVQISGSVVTPLKVSLSRTQYEQLLDTLDSLMTQSFSEETILMSSRRLVDIKEEEAELHTGVSTLNMDPALRARMLNVGSGKPKVENQHTLTLKVSFELPVFTVELRGDLGCGEQGLVDLSFRDFSVHYDKSHRYETHIQMSLRSLLMEDLSVEPESKHRRIVVSSAVTESEDKILNRPPEFYSKSCPNLLNHQPINNLHGSLPDHLETETVYGTFSNTKRRKSVKPSMKRTKTVEYPCTPPPSPRISGSPASMYREDNLVHINMVLVDNEAPNFLSHYEGLDRSVNVDFNSLDIIVNVESWVVILDFFGLGPGSPTIHKTSTPKQSVPAEKSSAERDVKSFNSELDIEIRSLTLVLNRPQYEVARANISHLSTQVRSHGHEQIIEGRLGSMSLLDLTAHGVLYRERFISSGHEALNFYMFRHRQHDPGVEMEYDSLLKLEMSSVLYVHTQRFVAEIQAFCHHFSQLQSVVNSIHSAAAGIVVPEERTRSTRLLLELHAGSPVILLPVSSQSPEILVVDLGKLSVNNSFCYAGAEGTISSVRKQSVSRKHSREASFDKSHSPEEIHLAPCLLDVMQIELVNMDLYAGQRETQHSDQIPKNKMPRCALELGSFCVNKKGPSLLREKCQLKLQVERNLDTNLNHDVPDMSVKGTLSALHGALDLSQYKLIRGLLSYNIGETLDDFEYDNSGSTTAQYYKQLSGSEGVWALTSIHLDLVDVILKLQLCHGIGSNSNESSLACINFIKSRLVVETYSNQSRDVDLVSQEILITDTRFQAEPVNRRSNVFTNILQPIHHLAGTDLVQAEVHHRKRRDFSKFTILLNNMRLMAILDWWEAVRDFIMENIDCPYGASGDQINHAGSSASTKYSPATSWTGSGVKGRAVLNTVEEIPYELKLNITDSEIVVVEDTSQWDTNAVILKSTTVVSYRPSLVDKPLSCNLNHCEMFSCILGMEDETALSIIDPVTVNIEVARRLNGLTAKGISDAVISTSDRVLEVQMQQQLNIRLSYHDMRMFIQMLSSLPKQTLWAKNHDSDHDQQPANVRNQIRKLSALGFHPDDCISALEKCNGHLDDAALWLTQHADLADTAVRGKDCLEDNHSTLSFHTVEIKATHICLCVIDDCRDSDVPLLELSLSQLALEQEIDGGGAARCILASDYYNRVLSGWEPFIEPWKCDVSWEHSLSTDLCRNRLQIHISADDILNVNITNTLVDLYKMVKENWTQDYYNLTPRERFDNGMNKLVGSPPGYRRRSPFVPFAIRNDTGSRIWFTTLITSPDSISDPLHGKESTLEQDEFWTSVAPGDTVPFSFEGRDKARHRDTHKLRIHQLGVRVDGWKSVGPVSIDKVGVYFRQASPEIYRTNLNLPPGRIVFEVTLEGSARKLVTIRSSLMLVNQLQETVEIKLENTLIHPGVTGVKCIRMAPGGILPIPLSYVMSYIWLRPIDRTQPAGHGYVFCNKPITWSHVSRPGETVEDLRMCISNREQCFRFCAAIHRENFPYERITSPHKWVQPAHNITLLSPITIVNLLPYDLHYSVKDAPSSSAGHIKPGQTASLTQVDIEKVVELCFHLENFPRAGILVVPMGANTFSSVVRLHDHQGRRLFLHGNVVCQRGTGLKVLITAPFWIINKTALPLVFRQEGVPTETAAGQFEEHEVARMVAPLLFSFADHEASPTVVARVGNGVHPEGIPQWCQHFHLQKGVQVRRLRISLRDSRPDIMYVIGINVRSGRGRYRSTNIVTLSPRFQLHNKSTYQLQFAQRCFATTLNDPGAQATYLKAVPDCCLPFHWPRLDKEQFLCVRLLDVPNCLWSGGFIIDTNDSLHINVRDVHGKMHFLRVEVVLQGATYFIVFTDADTIPPPIRLDNYSEVPLQFHQSCVTVESLLSTVRPHSCVPYAWDEPTFSHSITLLAPGGAAASYDMKSLGEDREAQGLTYENFIYIAFTGTFKSCSTQEIGAGNTSYNPLDVESQQLVLDVPEGTRVILSRKEKGARSQLWRMTGDGQLQHEGSSPPRDPRSKHSVHNDDRILVLDIAGPAPQPTQYVSLVLRRPDKRRKSTQTWHFTEDGRLCCAHNNMCVQAKDGFFGLHQGAATSGASWQMWSEAVLGPPQPVCHQLTNTGVPLEQAVSRQRLRPGSGFLAVKIITDGPTSVLHISDIKEKTYLVKDDRDWTIVAMSRLPTIVHEGAARGLPPDSRELQLKLDLPGGLGISLVSSQPAEELLFAHLTGIIMEVVSTGSQQKLNLLVKDIQCDNQLFEAQCPVVVYVTPPSARSKDAETQRNLPALRITTERVPSQNSNVATYKHFIVTVKNLSISIEERLLLKLFLFAGYSRLSSEQEDAEESDFEVQRILTEVTSVHAKKYYFGLLKLEPGHVKLSVMTSSKLPIQLQSIKRKLGLTLIKFEDASVDLKPFVKNHSFESSKFFVHSILKHYKDELKWQAAIILGSVDFLGSPLGFVNDVTEGVSGLLFEGNVQALVQNVTHGLSNSAAKVTESLSDGLGRVIMDEEHEETRQRIRKVHTGSSGDHIVAGLKGFGFGLLGGATSIFKQTYEGAYNEGFQGLISGFGKGLVGTVTKPVVGVLDLASEAASAVRDSSRSSSRVGPGRFRAPRCVTSPGGLLPQYTKQQSQGQEFLYSINKRNYAELFMAYECLRTGAEDLRILVSSEMVRVFSVGTSGTCTIVVETHLSDLYHCQPTSRANDEPRGSSSLDDVLHYIELTMRVDTIGLESIKRPLVRCDSEAVAKWVSQQVNYAKDMFEERRCTLISNGDNILED